MKKILNLSFAFAIATLTNFNSVYAATHVWNGFFGGNWSASGNWASGGAPTNNEPAPVNLVFPSTFVHTQACTNDVSGLQVDSIAIDSTGLLSPYYFTSQGVLTLTLRGGGVTITNAGSGTQFSARLSVVGSNIVSVGTGDISFSTIVGSGSLTVAGPGIVYCKGTTANAFSGPLSVVNGYANLSQSNGWGAVLSSVVVGDNQPGIHGYLNLSRDEQIGNGAPVTVNSSGVMHLNGYNESIYTLTMNGGQIYTDGGLLTLLGDVSQPNAGYGGGITGKLSLGTTNRTFNINSSLALATTTSDSPGVGLIKTGPGALQLDGTNTYSGPTIINGGDLALFGPSTNSDITVNTGARLLPYRDSGSIAANSGAIEFYGVNYSHINCRDFTLTNGATIKMKFEGQMQTNDQITAHGNITLNNAQLTLQATFDPPIGQKLVLIKNAGNNPVNGTFNGLPEGQIFTNSGCLYQITYQGGDGNDIVVSRILVGATQLTSITRSFGGGVNITGIAAAGASCYIQASTNLNSTNWVDLGKLYPDQNNVVQFQDSMTNFPTRFYRLRLQ